MCAMSDRSYTYQNYHNVLRELHAVLRPRAYFEIGVRRGYSLRLATRAERIVGVDPEPILAEVPGRNTKVFELTSDEFFERHDLRAELGGADVDLAFIDGMHLFENAYSDLVNLEPYCNERTLVAIHDCTPPNERSAARERDTALWAGDVWKLTLCLARYRPDLTMSVIDAAPSGLLLVSGLGSGVSTLDDSRDEIMEEYVPLGYDHYLATQDVPAGITRSLDDALVHHGLA